MLLDARDVADGAVLDTDVCVIGAGAAGITLARELAGSSISVLLLESGGFEYHERTQALYAGPTVGRPLDPQVEFGLDTPRLRYFGGTTNHWAGFCRPFEEIYLEPRTYVPRSGWPFGRDELDRFYPRAQEVCALGDLRYDWQSWNAAGVLPAPALDTAKTPSVVQQVTQSPRFADVYRDVLVGAANVTVCTWANVVDLAADPGSDALGHVEVATLRGNRFRARARVYVLATGGIEVPRLLLASNGVRPAGVGNEHDLVGRCFAEHPSVIGGVAVMTVDETALAAYLTGQHRAPLADGRDVELSVVVTIAAEVAREHGLRGSELSFGAVTSIDNPDIEAAFPGTRDGADLLAASGTPARTATIARLLCEQEPNPASRVALTRDRDELGIPKASLDWRLTGDDRASIVRSLEVYGSELARTGLGRFKIDLRPGLVDNTPWDGTLDFDVNNSSHHMGTARMHASPRQGVVDPDGRVHSVANLYIAGSSVFPTTGPQPPTVTIVALAIRLADHLRSVVLA